MANSSNQQFFDQLAKAKKILIVLPQVINADIAGTASGLALFLQKLKKEIIILSPEDYEITFPFLPKTNRLKLALTASVSLAVNVDISKKPLEEISYQQAGGKVKIFLKGKDEIFTPEDIGFETVKDVPYDLIIILGAQSLEDLGRIFEQSADVFYETTKVNIDNHPANKYFGGINLVDINASSISELTTALLQEFETDLFDEDIATCLLSGIIAKTRSFQHPQVSPRAFLKAGDLVAKGGRQQEIVRALFKTRSLSFLKLWGRSLVRLKDMDRWAFSVLTEADLSESESTIEETPLVLKEFMENLENKVLVALLAKENQTANLLIAVHKGINLKRLNLDFGPGKELKGLLYAPYSAWQFDLSKEANMEETQKKLENSVEALLKSAAAS